ncbi:D-alanyl-D-alanine carboxypeptidase/D-alanyl-D-alanine-endopeptidase [Corynebacterium sp.]|uniref:D-alanyl-D-alanine carboxypeptidase/D-alanyl-D-alanine endopeptidase n=1 Tax=Corynebacterium sp. TaxID=1720 RepID=UPI0025C04EA1|nr:D-alanyl-D-alanine carboxypeptidase/D-alanyl-D-alanine-endopeptidase [Corynebacterium sp.]
MSKSASRRWLYGILAFLVVVVVVVAAALVVHQRNAYTVADARPLPEPSAVLAPAETDGPAPDVGDELSDPASDPALGRLSGHVTDLATGEEIWSEKPDTMLVPASATKLATAAAALVTLDGGERVATRVYRGAKPGQIVLKGDGDVTLERSEGSGFFTDPANVDDLAAQVDEALGEDRVTEVVVDNSARAGSLFNKTWSRDDIGAGNVAPLSAVMVDAGRLAPSDSYSPRSSNPASDVGDFLAAALGGASGATVSVTDKAVDVGDEAPLAAVYSAPLSTRVRDMLLHSDNLLAEAVAREVAQARGEDPTFEGAAKATLDALTEEGIDVGKAVLRDNSGMSEDNRLNARILDGIVAAAGTDDDLRVLLDGLPVAAGDGTLADRYGQGSGASGGAGWVRAKTGTLDGVNTLAGTVTTEAGRTLSFAFLSNGSDADAGRAALDRLAAALRSAS